MDAKEAREKAINVNTSISLHEYNSIIRDITNAVKRGSFALRVDKKILPSTAEKLIMQGYNIETFYDENKNFTLINW